MCANVPSAAPSSASASGQGGRQGVMDGEGTAAEQPPDDTNSSQTTEHLGRMTLQHVNSADMPDGLSAELGLSAAELEETAAAVLAAQQTTLSDEQQGGQIIDASKAGQLSTSPFGSSFHSAMTGSLPNVISPTGETNLSAIADPATDGHSLSASHHSKKLQPERHMWSKEETQALVDGCNAHGVGNWKAILSDPKFSGRFAGRSAGDLKDRFRTYFPDAYHDMYPNAKTHTSKAVRSKAADGTSIFEKGKTKERRPFSAAEDEVLKRGYAQHGSHWATIARDAVFEGRRKSTDLRDRFRNAFPELYEQAGYKPRSKSGKKDRRPSHGALHSDSSMSMSISAALEQANGDGSDAMRATRVAPPPSDTSATSHSQCASGDVSHSELETSEGEMSDAWERPAGEPVLARRLMDQHRAQQEQRRQQEEQRAAVSRSSSFNDGSSRLGSGLRSVSRDTGALQVQQREHAANPNAPSSSSSSSASGMNPNVQPLRPDGGLRRTQSSKRANPKISHFEGMPSSTALQQQQRTHQHHHQQRLIQEQKYPQPIPHYFGTRSQDPNTAQMHPSSNEVPTSRPPLEHSLSSGHAPQYAWQGESEGQPSASSSSLDEMDLDQLNALLGQPSSSTTHLSNERFNGPQGDAMDVDAPTVASSTAAAPASTISDASANSTGSDLSSLLTSADLMQLAASSGSSTLGTSPSKNGFSIESFQDLLDPVLPPSTSLSEWAASAASWHPVSSSSVNSGTASAPSQTEHSAWAGDLLHRGSGNTSIDTTMQQPQQLQQSYMTQAQGAAANDPATLHAQFEDQRQQQFGPPSMRSSLEADFQRTDTQQTATDNGLRTHRFDASVAAPHSVAQSVTSTPSVQELVNRSASSRHSGQQANAAANFQHQLPFLPADLTSSHAMQSPYRINPYYPADDLSLTSLGSQTLFPSLVGEAPGHRRRRSTDTLRQNFSYAQLAVAFEPTPLDLPGYTPQQQSDEGIEEEPESESADFDESSGSVRRPFHGQSASFSGTWDRNVTIQPRATRQHASADESTVEDSFGGRHLSAFEIAAAFAAQHGNTTAFDSAAEADASSIGPYAESLPDLGHPSSSSTFDEISPFGLPQTSYDDLDLPSFLGRSPALNHAVAPHARDAAAGDSADAPSQWVQNHGLGGPSSGALQSGRAASESQMDIESNRQGSWQKAWSDVGDAASADPSAFQRTLATQEGARDRVAAHFADLERFDNSSQRWLADRPDASLLRSISTDGHPGPITSTASEAVLPAMYTAGDLDRLEHLYLEGLHPVSSSTSQGAARTPGNWSSEWSNQSANFSNSDAQTDHANGGANSSTGASHNGR
ncbi:hypothetical protein IE81DRAFT_323032 [Ceraceosorus guamensis]|uniref:Myb-like domain-containing protein n=1 Tax=Ceraceosorus guamensis TaxID=1522189 RepID=A0A316W043_9BASI|nr:hypothetical protein IE81DRAFT_323032 [Ceraceosorus guamensis]PWN42894.1 hypothetical protein IE81DRAFT_323032 [Ceraceosorus guamensis]